MSWNNPLFDTPFERRRLRILNSLFFAVAKMNGKPWVHREGERFAFHSSNSIFISVSTGLKRQSAGHNR